MSFQPLLAWSYRPSAGVPATTSLTTVISSLFVDTAKLNLPL